MVIGDISTYLEIVIGINTLSTVFWQSLNTLLDEAIVESEDVNNVLEQKQGAKARDAKRGKRKQFIRRMDSCGRIVALITAIICLYLLLFPCLEITHWSACLGLIVAPLPVLVFYIVRFISLRIHKVADENEAKKIGLQDLIVRTKQLDQGDEA